MKKVCLALLLLTSQYIFCSAQSQNAYTAIYSGTPWFDDRGNVVSAHAAGIVKDNNRFYLFGEKHSDTSNAFVGFNCYSSSDLYNWKFESLALPVQPDGKLGPNRVGERAKVMKCPKTGEYVMYMHVDSVTYRDQYIGYATSKNITGPYLFKGALLFEGKPIKKWDMGTFQDHDGEGYLLIHSGEMYRLNADYQSIVEQMTKSFTPGFEAPAVFKKDSLYYWIGSYLTGWERNDNYYFTATSLKGPWTSRGFLAPTGTLTWNSQSTFVLPVAGPKDTTYIFMGDRWAFPKQNSAATYIWQPLHINGYSLSMPNYEEIWKININSGTYSHEEITGKTISATDKTTLKYSGNWHFVTTDTIPLAISGTKSDSLTVRFKGSQISAYGVARPDGGYAKVTLRNSKGNIVLSSIIDMYSKYSGPALKFSTPILKKDTYTLTIIVTGEHCAFPDRKNINTGSTGNTIALSKFVVRE